MIDILNGIIGNGAKRVYVLLYKIEKNVLNCCSHYEQRNVWRALLTSFV